MSRLKVLLTNENFGDLAGASLYVRDVALGLLRLGHKPVVFSPQLGELAKELRAATVPVVDRLEDIAEEPDVIHGQHHLTTMKALLHFSSTPALYVCHAWIETPLVFPRVLRYVAVDEVCYDHLVSQNGVSPEKVKLLFNFADLRRFKQRGPLPATPKRALIFSNGVSEGFGLEAIREACARASLDLEAIGYGVLAAASNPEDVLPHYDIVFAKARCAIEAMAVGCAVVACDVGGMAGMVTSENLPDLRRLNFGRRSLVQPLDPTLLFEEIRRYSADDAGQVSRKMRATANLDDALGELIKLYEDVILDHGRALPDLALEMRATAAYLHQTVGPAAADPGGVRVRVTQPPPTISSELPDRMVLSLLDSVSLADIQFLAGRRVMDGVEADSSVLIETSANPWQYAATLQVSKERAADLADRAAVLRLRLRVHQGLVGIGLLNEDRTAFLARHALNATSDYVDVFMRVRRLDELTDLVIQSWDHPEAARIEVQAVDLYLVGTSD